MINNSFPTQLHLHDYRHRIADAERQADPLDGRPLHARRLRVPLLWLHKGRTPAANSETPREKDPRVALGA
jgi:hypothetical protein